MKHFRQAISFAIGILSLQTSSGQCNNTQYAVSYNGVISSVNTTTGALTTIASVTPASGVNNANAIAYAGGAIPKFYFFSNSNAGSLVFKSYTPTTLTFSTLSVLNGPTGTVNSGCITPNYKGYYCLDTYGYLYYYNITLNTWTTIATVIKDQTGTNITSTVAAYSSGDMAFDGMGNLWLLLANQTTYRFGLYKLPATVPTTNVGTVTIQEVVPLGSAMPDGYDPVGISFNAVGNMYISTLNTTTFAGNLYVWYGTQSTPALISSQSTVLLDLSSCSMPAIVLPVKFLKFSASLAKGSVELRWQVAQQDNVKEYTVERTQDGVHWEAISNIAANNATTANYSFTDVHPYSGRSYYRISEIDWNGKAFYSSTATVQITTSPSIRSWPNPVSDFLNVENPFSFPIKATIFDAAGRRILEKTMQPGTNQINTSAFLPGIYVLNTSQTNTTLTFVKSSTNK